MTDGSTSFTAAHPSGGALNSANKTNASFCSPALFQASHPDSSIFRLSPSSTDRCTRRPHLLTPLAAPPPAPRRGMLQHPGTAGRQPAALGSNDLAMPRDGSSNQSWNFFHLDDGIVKAMIPRRWGTMGKQHRGRWGGLQHASRLRRGYYRQPPGETIVSRRPGLQGDDKGDWGQWVGDDAVTSKKTDPAATSTAPRDDEKTKPPRFRTMPSNSRSGSLTSPSIVGVLALLDHLATAPSDFSPSNPFNKQAQRVLLPCDIAPEESILYRAHGELGAGI
ncbi:hypothetical protein BD779DRAFT_1469530 [Infundibulicybe gibba]|nr:hypothetical protein BD779DRAFT_1469530 [Infundibulicybe gibba]